MLKRLWIPIIIAITLGLILPATVVLAQGLGLSGNFYKQHYELSPGQASSGKDVYVVVSNPDESSVRVKMIIDVPDGVAIHLTRDEFSLASGEQQKIGIVVEANAKAIAGDYILTISAEAVREGTGIKITAGTQQQARLSVLGEGGQVTVKTIDETGENFPLVINILEKTNSDLNKVRSGHGTLTSRLKPGDYIARALYQELVLAEQAFNLTDQEIKEINLVCPTICVSEFNLAPNNSADKLISVKVGYTIANLQKPLPDVKAVLVVKLENKYCDEVELTSFSQMDPGLRSGTFNYSPAQGWQQKHRYNFYIELYSGNNLHYTSQQMELIAGEAPASLAGSESGNDEEEISAPVRWALIGGVIAGILVIAGLLVLLLIKRRLAY
jgi:hypothetical protein